MTMLVGAQLCISTDQAPKNKVDRHQTALASLQGWSVLHRSLGLQYLVLEGRIQLHKLRESFRQRPNPSFQTAGSLTGGAPASDP